MDNQYSPPHGAAACLPSQAGPFHGSSFGTFDNGITLLDGTCQKTDKAGLLADAARPGGISAQFVNFLYADQKPWPRRAVHVFNRSLGETTDRTSTIIADPAFALNHP